MSSCRVADDVDITVVPAEQQHVDGICRVCADGWRQTYTGMLSDEDIETTIQEFYTLERVAQEVRSPGDWDGWLVTLDDEELVSAGGGGLTEPNVGEVFVLYVNPAEKRRGIGSRLLNAITNQQREQGATEQWMSVVPRTKSASRSTGNTDSKRLANARRTGIRVTENRFDSNGLYNQCSCIMRQTTRNVLHQSET